MGPPAMFGDWVQVVGLPFANVIERRGVVAGYLDASDWQAGRQRPPGDAGTVGGVCETDHDTLQGREWPGVRDEGEGDPATTLPDSERLQRGLGSMHRARIFYQGSRHARRPETMLSDTRAATRTYAQPTKTWWSREAQGSCGDHAHQSHQPSVLASSLERTLGNVSIPPSSAF